MQQPPLGNMEMMLERTTATGWASLFIPSNQHSEQLERCVYLNSHYASDAALWVLTEPEMGKIMILDHFIQYKTGIVTITL